MRFEIPELEVGRLTELFDGVYEVLDESENELNRLSADPHDIDTIKFLYLNFHATKDNFVITGLQPFGDYLHAIEETYAEILNGNLVYTPIVKEVTLGALDRLRSSMAKIALEGAVDTEDLLEISTVFSELAHSDAEHEDEHAKNVLQVLIGLEGRGTGFIPPELELSTSEVSASHAVNVHGLDDDLKYFQTMAYLLDSRVPYWSGRVEKLMGTIGAVTPFLPYAVDRRQLHAAIYIHDMGMAFLAEDILLSKQKLSPDQQRWVHNHPHVGFQMLNRMPSWHEAAQIVFQHHEREDGSGYPSGLQGDEICNGARLLAVADAFCSMTCNRADRPRRRTVVRALMEINNYSGSQFHQPTVIAFTKMAAQIYRSG